MGQMPVGAGCMEGSRRYAEYLAFYFRRHARLLSLVGANVSMGAVAAFSRLSPTMHSWAISIYSYDYQGFVQPLFHFFLIPSLSAEL